MKQYLQFIEDRKLNELLEKVDDFYEFRNNESTERSKKLKAKIMKMESISKRTSLRLDEFFKEKLIFKLFNECKWNEQQLINKTNTNSISETVKTLAEKHGIKL